MNVDQALFISEATRKMVEESVLFVIGSGLSINWGIPSARDLADWLRERYDDYKQEHDISEPEHDLLHVLMLQHKDNPSLDLVADALAVNKCWFLRKLFYAPNDPPRLNHGQGCHPPDQPSNFFQPASYLSEGDPVAAGHIGLPHIVIGRLAREGLIQEILTTNYDSLIEAGCIAVGMHEWVDRDNNANHRESTLDAIPWKHAFRVVRSRSEFTQLVPRHNLFHIYKIHGCNEALAKRLSVHPSHQGLENRTVTDTESVQTDREAKCPSCTPTNHNLGCKLIPGDFPFVITRRELLDWRHDHWARDLFQDRARSHHLTLVGFGGEDAVIHGSLQSVYAEAVSNDAEMPPREQNPGSKQSEFRLQAVSRGPNIHLQQLLRSGLEKNDKPAGTLPPEQFYELGKDDTKGAVENLFRRLYVESIQQLFRRKLNIGGTAWLERIVARQNDTAAVSPNVADLHRKLGAGLEPGFLPQHVWFQTLPKLVMLSWLLNEPLQATAGEAYLSRLRRPHFYVPMAANEDLFYPLFSFVVALQRLANEKTTGHGLTMGPVVWHNNGWIEVVLHQPSGASGKVCCGALRRLLILPIVAPSDAHTARQPYLPRQAAQPPARAARWPGTSTIVLHLREHGSLDPLQRPKGTVRHALGLPDSVHYAFPYDKMLESQQFGTAIKRLVNPLPAQAEIAGVPQ